MLTATTTTNSSGGGPSLLVVDPVVTEVQQQQVEEAVQLLHRLAVSEATPFASSAPPNYLVAAVIPNLGLVKAKGIDEALENIVLGLTPSIDQEVPRRMNGILAALAYGIRELHLMLRAGNTNPYLSKLYYMLMQVYREHEGAFEEVSAGRNPLDYMDLAVYNVTGYDPVLNESHIEDWQAVGNLILRTTRILESINFKGSNYVRDTDSHVEDQVKLIRYANVITNYTYLIWQHYQNSGALFMDDNLIRTIQIHLKDMLRLAKRLHLNNPKFYRNVVEAYDNLLEIGAFDKSLLVYIAALAWFELRTIDSDYLSNLKDSPFWAEVDHIVSLATASSPQWVQEIYAEPDIAES